MKSFPMNSILERYSKVDVYGSLLEISSFLRSQKGIETRLSRVRIPRKLKKKFKKELNLRLGFTILKGKKLVVVSRDKYHRWVEHSDPHLADSYIQNVRIFTVFLLLRFELALESSYFGIEDYNYEKAMKLLSQIRLLESILEVEPNQAFKTNEISIRN